MNLRSFANFLFNVPLIIIAFFLPVLMTEGAALPPCQGKIPAEPYRNKSGQPVSLHTEKVNATTQSRHFPNDQLPGKVLGQFSNVSWLSDELRILASEDFTKTYGAKESWQSNLGNILKEFRKHNDNPSETTRLRNELSENKNLNAKIGTWLHQLVNDKWFYLPSWTGSKSQNDDGFYERRTEGFAEVATLISWNAPQPDACKAITGVKAAERHLGWYPRWRGLETTYDSVKAVEGIKRSKDNSFVVSQTEFDTYYYYKGWFGFFSGDYGPVFRMKMLEYFYKGLLTSVYYLLDSQDEFTKSWGFDHYITVDDSEGNFVCLIIVTTYVCDPDGEKAAQYVREGLGNLKYWAERPPAVLRKQ